MKIFFITLLICRMFALPAHGQADETAESVSLSNPERAFYRANIFYEAGNYDRAIQENRLLLDSGFSSGNLYYNLGNAYIKRGELGKAIANYERARRLIPRDSDLLANYTHARSLMKQPDTAGRRPLVIRWLDRVMSYLTLVQAIAIISVVYWLLIAVIITTRVFGLFRRYSVAVTGLLCFVMLLAAVPLADKLDEHRTGAIVTASITDARFEPLKDAPVHFSLYEGMKIRVLLDNNSGWYKVKRPDGKIGWTENKDVEMIGT